MSEERPRRTVFVVTDLREVPCIPLTIGLLQKIGNTWFEGTLTVPAVATIYNQEKQLRRRAREDAEWVRRAQERERLRLMYIREHLRVQMAPYDLDDPC